jgi:asparagine synthase (glutamine-hydrolysing)
MCGICGVIGVERGEAEATVRGMMAALHHRGPDDEGMLAVPHVVLGIRRLSIIDLAGGHQPVFNEDRSVAVVFNGEIYNFQELRRILEVQGHVFRSHSDTEVIVHAYEVWGENCVHHLRGMFAFAVFDQRRSPGSNGPRVFLARDRLGIKPLYYARANGALLFASEVRALLASGRIKPRLSRASLESYLLFGSLAEPMTLVEGVFSLPPGHCLLVPDAAHPRAIEPVPYWSFEEAALAPSDTPPRDLPTAAQRLRPLLEGAVRSHLIADVPLGLFLSSGLDSTAIASLASREQKGIHTFTVVFPEQEFSEALLARRTAERLGTRHQELALSVEQMLERLEDAVGALDQPTMDGINTYFVSLAARQVGLKVALSGLGGDEVFGGYSTFGSTPRAARVAALGRWLPRAARSAVASALVNLGDGRRRADARRKLAALWRSPDALPHAYFYARALFTPEQTAKLLQGAPLEGVEQPWRAWLEETARQAERLDSFAATSCLEMRSYMVNTLLRDTDAVSMSHSLEVRVPLLDHKLVEFALRLPKSAKRRRGMPKALLIESLGDLLPQDVVRQRKRTFTFPWERWLRGALGGRVAAGLADLTPALRPFLDQESVCHVWRDFLAGRTSWSRPWSLYVLNCWCAWQLDAGVASGERARPAAALSGAPSSGTFRNSE